MPSRKPTTTNYGTAALRKSYRKDELRERRSIKRDEKRAAIREGKES
jgi:hypothetical protein